MLNVTGPPKVKGDAPSIEASPEPKRKTRKGYSHPLLNASL